MPKPKTVHRRKTRKVIRFKWLNIAIATGAVLFIMFYRHVEASTLMLSPEGDTPIELLSLVYDTNEPSGRLVDNVLAVTTSDAMTPTPTKTQSSPVALSGNRDSQPTKEQVVEYMRSKFGDAFEMAYAVARVEGWPHHEGQGWDRNLCWYKFENGRNKGENSWGIFQINLVQGCNAEGKKIHWNRVPGETLQEKVEWLNNPFNNIDLAHQIYSEQGWRPWTGYTSGNYKKYMH